MKTKTPDAMHIGPRCVDRPDVKAEASIRSHNGRYSRTNTPLAADADAKNICAQLAVLHMLRQSVDLMPTKKTQGWDFVINGRKVKVMGAKEGGNLAIKERKTPRWADIYILCWIIKGEPHVIRWCKADQVQAATPTILKYDGPYKQPTHRVYFSSMSRDLLALRQELGLAARQEGLF